MRLCNPDVNYSISKDVSDRINIFRLIMTVLVIYNHAYGAISPFSSELASAVSFSCGMRYTRIILSQILGRSTVQGFFLVSAILLYRKPFNWLTNMKRKLRSLAVPYLIMNFAWIFLFLVLQQFSFASFLFGNPDNIIKNWTISQWIDAILGIQGNLVPFLYPLWFLRDLLILNFLAPIIWKLVDKLPEPTLLLALFVWFKYAISNTHVPDFQSVCFWVFGAYMVKRNIRLDILDKVPLLIWIAIAFFLIRAELPRMYVPEFLWLYNLCMLYGVFLIFALTKVFRTGKLKDGLLKLSAYSFSIYLFHEFTTLTFRKVASTVFPVSALSQFLQYLLIPLVVVLFCLALSVFIKKLMPRFYTVLTGGRS